MSSKKDLLDRMAAHPNRTPAGAQRRPNEASGEPAKETQTRVGGTVIRRRTDARPEPVRRPGDPAPAPAPVSSRPAAPAQQQPARPAGAPTTIVRKRPPEADARPRGPELPALAEEPAMAPEPEPEFVPEPVAPPVVEAAPEPVVVPEPPAPPAAVVEAAPEPVAAPEPQPAPPLPPPPPPREARPVLPRPPEPPPREARPADQRPAESRSVPVSTQQPPLPAAGPDQRPRLPGLGRAVVRPPPDYDPNDPLGAQRRREAAQAAARPAAPAPQPPRWEDPRRGPVAPPPAADDDRGNRRRRQTRVEMDPGLTARRRRGKKGAVIAKPVAAKPKIEKRKLRVDGTISVRTLAHEMSVKAADVLRVLLGLGQISNINEQLDFDTAQVVAQEFEYEVVNVGFSEDQHMLQIDNAVDDESAIRRPPVVTVMGHVDHGKTTLLDTIRKARVAAGEAGGITQHIGAYQVKREKNLITFIDTPGHAAFTEMRARGAQVTDVVILVVAADDGVMPQTVEAINHAKAAKVPIVVAVNKVDKAGVRPERIRQELMTHGLVPEEYGGDTLMVNVSAMKGTGIDDLLDAVLLVSELLDLRANPERHAEGVVLEAKVEPGRGTVASLLVKTGTLNKDDALVVGTISGKVRAMMDSQSKRIKSAGPSTPVEILGLDGVPQPGETFSVVSSEKDAKTLAEHRAELARNQNLSKRSKISLQDILTAQKEEEVKKLNLVIKGDVQGSIEALRAAVSALRVPGTEVNILHCAVGGISESDITLAATYSGIVIGFNVRPDAKARGMAESKEVEVRTYKIIYEVLDDITKALKGMLDPIRQEKVHGHAEIRQVFSIPKVGTIAGCMITDGKVARSQHARLVRNGVVVWEGRLSSLRRFKDDVREVEKGYECGLSLENFQDIKIGDELETYTMETVAPI